MPFVWVNHKGKKILHADYSNIKDQKVMLETLAAGEKMMREAKDGFLLLSNLTDCVIGKEFKNRANELGKEFIKEKAIKHAIIGVTGLKSILVKTYATFSGDDLKVFSDETAAKDYLAQ